MREISTDSRWTSVTENSQYIFFFFIKKKRTILIHEDFQLNKKGDIEIKFRRIRCGNKHCLFKFVTVRS
jgi:hypothetical protein